MTDRPITVGELLEYLKQLNPSDVVMIRCEDDYYSGALTVEQLDKGHALLTDPFDWQSAEDELGKPRESRTFHYPGGWNLEEDGLSERTFSERIPCLVIKAGRYA